jgi:ATP-dependent DNA helicase RecQ
VQLLPAGANRLEQAWRALEELRRLAALDAAWDWSRAAVIAREWKVLEPLRAACEIAGIACHFAGRRQAELPLWRWREVWRLIVALRERRAELISAAELRALAKSLRGEEPDTPGQALVAALIDDSYAGGAGDFPRPALAVLEDAYEYLAELGREPGNGLTLSTAHGAKGLEFDHVLVLDGGWQPSSLAERRLYYVAMTRARQTLTLCRMDQRGFAGELAGQAAVLERPALPAAALPAGLRRRYQVLGPREIDLGFAGRGPGTVAVRQAVARLYVGDELRVEVGDGRWLFKTAGGQTVGRAAASYAPPAGRLIVAKVASICVWRREDAEPEWRERMHAECWEVVFPELVFEPSG